MIAKPMLQKATAAVMLYYTLMMHLCVSDCYILLAAFAMQLAYMYLLTYGHIPAYLHT